MACCSSGDSGGASASRGSSNSSGLKPQIRLPSACIRWWVRSAEKPAARNMPVTESMYARTVGVRRVRDSMAVRPQGWRRTARRAGRRLDLRDEDVDHPVEQLVLVLDVLVQRHGDDAEVLGERAHADRAEAGPVGERDGGLQHADTVAPFAGHRRPPLTGVHRTPTVLHVVYAVHLDRRRPLMNRSTAITAGVLYLVSHVTSIAAVVLYGGFLDDPLRSGGDTRVLVGGLCDVVLAMAVVGTAVALYPVVRRSSEGLAIGYVGLRTLEAAVIVAGVVALLAVGTLRQSGAATAPVAEGLVAVRDWTFLIGPGLVCGTNTVVLAALMYRSRLVPRFIAVLGLVGGPLVFSWI